MASFGQHLKENLKKSFIWLKDLNKRDLLRKSELSTLPRLFGVAASLVGLIGYALVPFPIVAATVGISTVAGFVAGAVVKPKRMLEFTALGSVATFAMPGVIVGGLVAGVQFGVMMAAKSVFDVFKSFKSAMKDHAKNKAAQKTDAATPVAVPETPAVVPAAAAPAFNAANENKPAAAPAAPVPAVAGPKP